MRIFLSYRRKDAWAASVVPRLRERLAARVGEDEIFWDVDSGPPGRDFRATIDDEISKTDILLVLIGNAWSRLTRNRLPDAVDYVRTEVECAFREKLPVIPVLIGHATRPPRENDLPPSIKQLAFCNAITLDPGLDFEPHVTRLVERIERYYGKNEAEATRNKAADDHDALAWNKLKEGRSNERRENFPEAARLYRDAALAAVKVEGDPQIYLTGQNLLRPKFIHVLGGDRTFLSEIETRAQKGETEAQFAMAEFNRDSLMSFHDWPSLLADYEKVAAKGFVPAMFRLAQEFEAGYREGDFVIPGDNKMAAHWYRAAAEALLKQ